MPGGTARHPAGTEEEASESGKTGGEAGEAQLGHQPERDRMEPPERSGIGGRAGSVGADPVTEDRTFAPETPAIRVRPQ